MGKDATKEEKEKGYCELGIDNKKTGLTRLLNCFDQDYQVYELFCHSRNVTYSNFSPLISR